MKQITTGTKITFKETNEKFSLTQTETGFDVRQIKLSKNVPAEPYSFQEFLDMYENDKISIEGFEETDSGLVHSIITNYIYQQNIKEKLIELSAKDKEIDELKNQLSQISELTAKNEEFRIQNSELTAKNAELEKRIISLEETISAMKEE